MRMSRRMVAYGDSYKAPWLYDSGTENTDVTGGLTAYAYVPSTSGSSTQKPEVTKNTGSLKLRVPNASGGLGGSYFTTNTVDLTRAKKIKITVDDIGTNTGYVRIGATTTKADKFVVAKAKSLSEAGTFEVDISSLTGAHYLFITLYGSGVKYIEFTKWWLE